MLFRLLRLISASEGVATMSSIARSMDITENLLAKMMEDAVGLGYLALSQTECGDTPCGHCRRSTACLTGNSPKLWTLTEKGRRLLADRS